MKTSLLRNQNTFFSTELEEKTEFTAKVSPSDGTHMACVNIIHSTRDDIIRIAGFQDKVYKLRINIDGQYYSNHFSTIESNLDRWLHTSLCQTPFAPFTQKPEWTFPLVRSYKYYPPLAQEEKEYLISTGKESRIEGKAQFTLWLPDCWIQGLPYLKNCTTKTEYCLSKNTSSQNKKMQLKLIYLAQLKEHFHNETLSGHNIHQTYWEKLADWMIRFESILREKNVPAGGLDNADLRISDFFSLRRTAFEWEPNGSGYVPAEETETVHQLKELLSSDPIYISLLNRVNSPALALKMEM